MGAAKEKTKEIEDREPGEVYVDTTDYVAEGARQRADETAQGETAASLVASAAMPAKALEKFLTSFSDKANFWCDAQKAGSVGLLQFADAMGALARTCALEVRTALLNAVEFRLKEAGWPLKIRNVSDRQLTLPHLLVDKGTQSAGRLTLKLGAAAVVSAPFAREHVLFGLRGEKLDVMAHPKPEGKKRWFRKGARRKPGGERPGDTVWLQVLDPDKLNSPLAIRTRPDGPLTTFACGAFFSAELTIARALIAQGRARRLDEDELPR